MRPGSKRQQTAAGVRLRRAAGCQHLALPRSAQPLPFLLPARAACTRERGRGCQAALACDVGRSVGLTCSKQGRTSSEVDGSAAGRAERHRKATSALEVASPMKTERSGHPTWHFHHYASEQSLIRLLEGWSARMLQHVLPQTRFAPAFSTAGLLVAQAHDANSINHNAACRSTAAGWQGRRRLAAALVHSARLHLRHSIAADRSLFERATRPAIAGWNGVAFSENNQKQLLQQQWRRHHMQRQPQRRWARAAAAAAGQSSPKPLARSVRPIPITIVTVAKGSSRGAEMMAAEWADKLKRCGAAWCWQGATGRTARLAGMLCCCPQCAGMAVPKACCSILV